MPTNKTNNIKELPMKDIILVVSIVVAVLLTVVLIRFNDKASKATKALEQERYNRMVAEETLQKNAAKITSLEEQLKVATDKMSRIQDILDQEQTVNQDLKKQYEQLAQTKASLEEKLQQAITVQESVAAVEAVPVEAQPVVEQVASEVKDEVVTP